MSQSPITENFLTDIKEQLRVEFEKSFRNLKEYEFLEKELQKAIDSVKMVTVDLIANVPVSKEPQSLNKPVDEVKMNKVENKPKK